MATVTTIIDFLADLQGFTDMGQSTKVGCNWASGDGSPASGSMAIRENESGTPPGTYTETFRQTTPITWESFYTIPAGNSVQTVQLTGWRDKLADLQVVGLTAISQSLVIRMVDASGNAVLAADLLSASLPTSISGWTTHGSGSAQTVNTTYQPSASNIYLEVFYSITVTGNVLLIWSQLLDTLTFDVTYSEAVEPPPDPPEDGDDDDGPPDGDGVVRGDDTPECDPTQDPLAFRPLANELALSTAWVHDNRYYLSIGARTLCYDTTLGAWTDSGYGFIQQGQFFNLPFRGDIGFLLMPGVGFGAPVLTPEFRESNYIAYTSPLVKGSTPFAKSPFNKSAIYGPFDGQGLDRECVKRVLRVRLWGDYDEPNDATYPLSPIGTVKFWTDTGYTEIYNILPYKRVGYDNPNPPRIYEAAQIVEQWPTRELRGRLIWMEFTFNDDCVTPRDCMMEYVRVQENR